MMRRSWTKYAGLSLGVMLLAVLPACGPSMIGAGAEEGRILPRRPGAMHPNWEYFCHAVNMSNADEVFNEAGAQGWEMVTVAGAAVCFKRPLPPPGYPPVSMPAPGFAPPPPPAAPPPPPAPAS